MRGEPVFLSSCTRHVNDKKMFGFKQNPRATELWTLAILTTSGRLITTEANLRVETVKQQTAAQLLRYVKYFYEILFVVFYSKFCLFASPQAEADSFKAVEVCNQRDCQANDLGEQLGRLTVDDSLASSEGSSIAPVEMEPASVETVVNHVEAQPIIDMVSC